ncbi:hypothetical protein KIW84_066132 [Lathyrus oleraceus]|uniref:Retrovirus-related Pol polyprotein from transposon TNT 1-94-like beta-barrel domain-containing protein n=1 Tax=Pisum sativum TaxID=3888 RepID=A0A9D5ADE8_PEA|nr:hypothetical protein KIW84_066132 [Pisum sativum]
MCKQVESQKKEITQLENEKTKYLETISKLQTEAVVLNAKLDKNPQAENQKIAQLESEKADHAKTISKLKTEVMFQNSKLEEMTKYVRMLSNGSDSLDKILQTGQITGDKSSIGYNNSKPESSDTGVKPQAKLKYIQKPVMSHHMPAHHQDHYQFRPKQHMPIIKKQWVPKANVTSLIAHIPLKISAKEEWYFDSGCSRHMTGNQDLLTDLHHHTISHVTFGDGAKGEIKGTGKLDCLGVPKLDKVLLVKGLTTNLISISQLCDQDALKSDENQGRGKCHTKMSHHKLKGEKVMMAQKTERLDQTGGHMTSHMENGTIGTKPQGTLCKKAKDNTEKIWMTPVKVKVEK